LQSYLFQVEKITVEGANNCLSSSLTLQEQGDLTKVIPSFHDSNEVSTYVDMADTLLDEIHLISDFSLNNDIIFR